MDRWTGRVAIVTGASAGIGATIATALVSNGMKVIGCGRQVERIQKLSEELAAQGLSGSLEPVKCDLSKEDNILEMFEMATQKYGGVDVCINNAGVLHQAPLLSGSTQKWSEMLNVNVLGLSICTREAYKAMKHKLVDDGHIINISSMSGHRLSGAVDTNFYAATKFAVRAMTEGVRSELRKAKSNIRVSEISPGFVETEIFAHAAGKEYSENLFQRYKALDAKDVADAVVYLLSAPPHVQVHDILMRHTEQVP